MYTKLAMRPRPSLKKVYTFTGLASCANCELGVKLFAVPEANGMKGRGTWKAQMFVKKGCASMLANRAVVNWRC